MEQNMKHQEKRKRRKKEKTSSYITFPRGAEDRLNLLISTTVMWCKVAKQGCRAKHHESYRNTEELREYNIFPTTSKLLKSVTTSSVTTQ